MHVLLKCLYLKFIFVCANFNILCHLRNFCWEFLEFYADTLLKCRFGTLFVDLFHCLKSCFYQSVLLYILEYFSRSRLTPGFCWTFALLSLFFSIWLIVIISYPMIFSSKRMIRINLRNKGYIIFPRTQNIERRKM